MPAGLGVVTQVSAGTEHTCALKNDGSLACWGWNDNGQTNVPAGLGGVTQVSAGGEHTCARKTDGTVACWGWNQDGQLNVPSIPSARINPTATFDAPTSVVAGQSFTLALNNAQVPGYTGSVTFTYAFDCGDGSGYGGFGPGVSVSCATSNAGSRTVRGTVKDDEGDATEYSATVEVTPAPGGGFSFSGFFAPLDNVAVNVARAGSAIPVKFSLGGDHGLAIFASGYPKFIFTPCPAAESEDPVDETTAAPRSGLSCADGQYTYAWKTEKSWAGKCGTLMLTFTDGTSHSAQFRFSK